VSSGKVCGTESSRTAPPKVASESSVPPGAKSITFEFGPTMIVYCAMPCASVGIAKDLIASVSASSQLGWIVFSTDVENSIPLSTDSTAIVNELDRLPAMRKHPDKGIRKTALWDAMARAIDLFGAPETGDTLYVISDGIDNASRAYASDFERFAGEIRIFAFQPNPFPANVTPLDSPTSLPRLATLSGGSVLVISSNTWPPGFSDSTIALVPASTDSQIRWAEQAQLARIGSFYRLEIELSRPVAKKSDLALETSRREGARTRRWNLAEPTALWPCKLPSASDDPIR